MNAFPPAIKVGTALVCRICGAVITEEVKDLLRTVAAVECKECRAWNSVPIESDSMGSEEKDQAT